MSFFCSSTLQVRTKYVGLAGEIGDVVKGNDLAEVDVA